LDKDSLYYSRERWRIIPRRVDQFTVSYMLIDSYENELVAEYPKMSEAMEHRDRLDPA
jgi:hypothetical protein